MHYTHYGIQSTKYVAPKIWDLVAEEIKNKTLWIINQITHFIKSWSPSDCPCQLCKTCMYVCIYIYIYIYIYIQYMYVFFSIRVFFHEHRRHTGQQVKGGDHLLFNTNIQTFICNSTCDMTITYFFNRNACIWDLPPHRITIWLMMWR